VSDVPHLHLERQMALKCHTTVTSGSGTGVVTTGSWYRKNHVKQKVTATVLKYAHHSVQVFNMNTWTMDGTRSTTMTKKCMRIFVGVFYVGVKSLMIMSYCDVFCLWFRHVLVPTRCSDKLMCDRLHLRELDIIYQIHSPYSLTKKGIEVCRK
jgi:hypothetical protein